MIINFRQEYPFTLSGIDIKKTTLDLLRTQVQFYFSPRNLLTDAFLVNIIKCNRGGWVDNRQLLNFNKIDQIFRHFFEKSMTSQQKKYVLRKACQNSQFLDTDTKRIRIKGNPSLQNMFDRCFYIEGPQSEDQLRQECHLAGISQDLLKIRRQKDGKWFIVQYPCQNPSQFVYALMQTSLFQSKGKILKAQQFLNYQKTYLELIGVQPMAQPINLTDVKYKIPSGRIVSYEQTQSYKIGRKERKSKVNKGYQTRLPRKYITIKKTKTKHHILENRKLFLDYHEHPKKIRTVQQHKEYQRKKMIERRLRKEQNALKRQAQKHNRDKMVAENPLK